MYASHIRIDHLGAPAGAGPIGKIFSRKASTSGSLYEPLSLVATDSHVTPRGTAASRLRNTRGPPLNITSTGGHWSATDGSDVTTVLAVHRAREAAVFSLSGTSFAPCKASVFRSWLPASLKWRGF